MNLELDQYLELMKAEGIKKENLGDVWVTSLTDVGPILLSTKEDGKIKWLFVFKDADDIEDFNGKWEKIMEAYE